MRIAISGSHSLGKSTFVRDFLSIHQNYAFEEEPYRAIMHQHEIKFAEEQTQQHIMLQLTHCIDRLKNYAVGDNVICDRSPADYIPYTNYSVLYGQKDIDKAFLDSLYPLVIDSLKNLDLIIFIPISPQHPIDLEDDGHRPTHDVYREWVDEAFKKLYRENLNSIIPAHSPKVIEIVGNRQERIARLNQSLNTFGK